MIDFQAAAELVGGVVEKTASRIGARKTPDYGTVANKLEGFEGGKNEQTAAEETILLRGYFSDLGKLIRAGSKSPFLRDDVSPEIYDRDPSTSNFLKQFMRVESGLIYAINTCIDEASSKPDGYDRYAALQVAESLKQIGLTDLLDSTWRLFDLVKMPGTGLDNLGTMQSSIAAEIAIRYSLQHGCGLVTQRANATLDSRCGIDLIVYRNQKDLDDKIPLLFVDAKTSTECPDEVLIESLWPSVRHIMAMKKEVVEKKVFMCGYGDRNVSEIPHLVMYFPSVNKFAGTAYIDPVVGLPSLARMNGVIGSLERYCAYNGSQDIVQLLT